MCNSCKRCLGLISVWSIGHLLSPSLLAAALTCGDPLMGRKGLGKTWQLLSSSLRVRNPDYAETFTPASPGRTRDGWTAIMDER